MPRIIAGKARRIRLSTPKGEKTRPTTEKIKEALFSILMPYLEDALFLDVYAGSGQIGLEAVSRGAKAAYLLEQSSAARKCILENIKRTGLDSQTFLYSGPVERSFSRLKQEGLTFDLIYLDPPWQHLDREFTKIAPALSLLLKPEGFLILEHASNSKLADNVINLQSYRRCQYGAAMLSFYQSLP